MRIILVSLLLAAVIVLTACSSEEARIKETIADSQYCEQDSDCVLLGGQCPFGCYIAVNTTHADTITSLMQNYQSNCAYSCIQCKRVMCTANRCSLACE